MTQFLFSGISAIELLEKVGQLIDSKLSKVASPQDHQQPKFLTRQEAARLLKISLPTLHDWTKSGIIQSYKVGSRVLYKSDEIEVSVSKSATYKFKKGGGHA